MSKEKWHDLGTVDILKELPLREITINNKKIALSYLNEEFGAVDNVCNHVGGPLGKGRLDGDFIVCPWHNWKFHRIQGIGEPGFEQDRVPQYELKIENDNLLINLEPKTQRHKTPHPPHPLSRPIKREDGPIRVVGISTTAMDAKNPRYSTSDKLLEVALDHAKNNLGAQTMLIKLNDLEFRTCEGYYSKSKYACTWPCSITQMDPDDQMEKVYESVIFWADVIIVSTPIRWGNASSLYYKMVERMNCIQNNITLKNKSLVKNKVASFIITGGQDNIQAVAGQMLGFFAEYGFIFPPFPYIATSRGWAAEDMENNIKFVEHSTDLREGAQELARSSIEMAKLLLEKELYQEKIVKSGRKAQPLHVKEQTE